MRKVLLVALTALGCGQSAGEPASVDGGSAALAPREVAAHPVRAELALAAMRSHVVTQGPFALTAVPEGDGSAFERVGESFSLHGDPRSPERLLPSVARGGWSLRASGMRLRAELVGASAAEGRVVDGVVVYEGAIDDADLAMVPLRDGFEELVRLRTRRAEPALRYRVSLEGVAGVRHMADAPIELLSADGAPRLRIGVPTVVDAKGVARRGSLALEGCAYDTSESDPHGRAVTPPGATSCTVVVRWPDAGLTYPLLVDPTWATTGSMATRRYLHSMYSYVATGTCASGCAVAVAGKLLSGETHTSEIYSFGTKTWASIAGLTAAAVNYPVSNGDVVVLSDGSAIFAGGGSGSGTTRTYSNRVWLRTPTTNWTLQTATVSPRDKLKGAAVEATGWFVGGYNGTTDVGTFEQVQVSGGVVSVAAKPSLPTGRSDHAYVAMKNTLNTRHLVVGGSLAAVTQTTVYTWDGTAGSWSSLAGLSVPRESIGAAVLGGSVYFAGGGGGSFGTGQTSLVDRYDLATNTYNAAVGSLAVARSAPSLAPIGVGGTTAVFAVGGYTTSTGTILETYGTKTAETLSGTSPVVVNRLDLNEARFGHVAVSIGTGVLAAGGMVKFAKSGSTLSTTDELFIPSTLGTACTTKAECGSLQCVDGVCCNTSCTEQCAACNVAGKVGTCSPVTGTPVGSRSACVGAGTTCGSSCNGVTTASCTFAPSTTTCSTASCATASEVLQAATCDGLGTCKTPTKVDCGKYNCSAGKCITTCATNADCSTGNKCNTSTGICETTGDLGAKCTVVGDCKSGNCVNGVCCSTGSCGAGESCAVPGFAGTCKLPFGAACTTATAGKCGGGNCVDGVCCNTACTGQCESCAISGSAGTCLPVVGAPVSGRTSCAGTGVCQGKCDGSDRLACKSFPGTETECKAKSCAAGVESSSARCDGAGACGAPVAKSCAPFICADAVSCKTLCTTSSDCASGYVCKDGACRTTGALGSVCTDDFECTSGFCAQGEADQKVCCSASSCGTDGYCGGAAATGKVGQCIKRNGSTCAGGTECGSGFCVDGVCCESECSGQCEACDGSVKGKCATVTGAPHGSRAKCSDGAGDVCRALVCDGSNRVTCVGFANGPTTECKAASCSGDKVTKASFCDGSGTCKAGATESCSPYKCGDGACKSSCETSADCASGFFCNPSSKACEAIESKCSEDGNSSVPLTGGAAKPCGAYKCNSSTGDCYTQCSDSSSCATGFACAAGTCTPVPQSGDTGEDGGCSVGPVGSDGNVFGGVALALLGLGLVRRRRA